MSDSRNTSGRAAMPRVSRRVGPWPWYLTAADAIGFDVDLVEAIAGDLAELCGGLSGSALLLRRGWCVAQAIRAVPHLAISTVRRGDTHARLRLLGTLVVIFATITTAMAVPRLRVGPPTQIVTDRGFEAKDIVINNVRPVQIPVRALDAYGHTVPDAALRYERLSGDAIEVTAAGAVSCATPGDAVVRASLGGLQSLVTIRCRPVTGIHATAWYDFLPGDGPRSLGVEARGLDGQVVRELRGLVRISDTGVATLHRGLLTPRGFGSSRLTISLGETRANLAVNVHEIVDRFDRLTPAQRNVAIRMRLEPRDTVHIALPAGNALDKVAVPGRDKSPSSDSC